MTKKYMKTDKDGFIKSGVLPPYRGIKRKWRRNFRDRNEVVEAEAELLTWRGSNIPDSINIEVVEAPMEEDQPPKPTEIPNPTTTVLPIVLPPSTVGLPPLEIRTREQHVAIAQRPAKRQKIEAPKSAVSVPVVSVNSVPISVSRQIEKQPAYIDLVDEDNMIPTDTQTAAPSPVLRTRGPPTPVIPPISTPSPQFSSLPSPQFVMSQSNINISTPSPNIAPSPPIISSMPMSQPNIAQPTEDNEISPLLAREVKLLEEVEVARKKADSMKLQYQSIVNPIVKNKFSAAMNNSIDQLKLKEESLRLIRVQIDEKRRSINNS